MNWSERDGPPVSAPKRRGFGTTVPLQERRRNAPLCRPRGHRRQSRQHRARHENAGSPVNRHDTNIKFCRHAGSNAQAEEMPSIGFGCGHAIWPSRFVVETGRIATMRWRTTFTSRPRMSRASRSLLRLVFLTATVCTSILLLFLLCRSRLSFGLPLSSTARPAAPGDGGIVRGRPPLP
jgi:hypothetical protein